MLGSYASCVSLHLGEGDPDFADVLDDGGNVVALVPDQLRPPLLANHDQVCLPALCSRAKLAGFAKLMDQHSHMTGPGPGRCSRCEAPFGVEDRTDPAALDHHQMHHFHH